jgi:predicted alpha/beta hydrolase family esterase
MERPILIVHSAGPQGSGEGSSSFVDRLRGELGAGYEVLFPTLPNPNEPSYEPWSMALAEILAGTDEPLIVVGHSLGGSVILKHLAESDREERIAGLVLVATPYWGESDWEAEWALPEGWPDAETELPRIFLFQSRDDEEIPFEHLERYARRLPAATAIPLDGNGHLFDRGELGEIAATIRGLSPDEGRSFG